MKLTEEQKKLLILIGSPDDGSQLHVVEDGGRITKELVQLGLLYCTGRNAQGRECYDLTDAGEQLYDQLSGRKDRP